MSFMRRFVIPNMAIIPAPAKEMDGFMLRLLYRTRLLSLHARELDGITHAFFILNVSCPSRVEELVVGVGIGGTFDFIRKNRKRAPKRLRMLKLEWLYRLFVEPSLERMTRLINAYFKFCFLIYKSSLTSANLQSKN